MAPRSRSLRPCWPIGMRYLLLVGAHRQNEGLPDTFSAALRRLPAANPATEIQLGALNLEEIAALLNDALPSASETMPLAELIWQKTEGNPFFVAQFLTLVHLERLIVFEHDSGKWFGISPPFPPAVLPTTSLA
jgi:predicted ATPase